MACPRELQSSLQLFAGVILLISLSQASPAISNNASSIYEYARDPKTLMYFPFVKLIIPPEPCGEAAMGVRQGVCLPPGGCKVAGGEITSSGSKCNNGFGECCRVMANCSADNPTVDVKEYVTVLRSPTDTANNQCTFRIRRKKDACQVRLDFIQYATAHANVLGNCEASSLRIGPSATTPSGFTTCGTLTGQHMYLTYRTGSDIIEVTPRILSNENYMIVATQIPCYSKRIAPSYCLQYFNKSVDIVKSFDFGFQQQNNQIYTICVENFEQSDRITWQQCSAADAGSTGGIATTSFNITTPDPAQPAGQISCTRDYVQAYGQDKNCGVAFSQVRMGVKPYNLLVHFDDNEVSPFPPNFPPPGETVPDEATCNSYSLAGQWACTWNTGQCTCAALVPPIAPPEIGNTGFCLRYTTN